VFGLQFSQFCRPIGLDVFRILNVFFWKMVCRKIFEKIPDVLLTTSNVVPGEWYGEKIPSIPLTETYQSSHFTSNLVS